MSATKASALLTAVQLNPEIGTDDASFVTDIIQRAARWLADQVGVERYPDLSQGYSVSGASPSTDISSLSTNRILVSIDDSAYNEITLTLVSLTSGAAIATELQTQIRAVSDEGPWRFVTVAYGTEYTITSPTYGEVSAVNVSYSVGYEDVAQGLKLSPDFGGTEYFGGAETDGFDDMVIRIVNHWYNTVGVEGLASYSIPGSTSGSVHDVDPHVHAYIMNNRRVIQ